MHTLTLMQFFLIFANSLYSLKHGSGFFVCGFADHFGVPTWEVMLQHC